MQDCDSSNLSASLSTDHESDSMEYEVSVPVESPIASQEHGCSIPPNDSQRVTQTESGFTDYESEPDDMDIDSDEPDIDIDDTDYEPDDTPSRRMVQCENVSTTDTACLVRSASVSAFVREINQTSKCGTHGCNGILECSRVSLLGLGGTIRMSFKCNGCSERAIEFNGALGNEVGLSCALQVAFLCAGCQYAQYNHVLQEGLGMYSVSDHIFFIPLS